MKPQRKTKPREATPAPQQATDGGTETKPTLFVVVRDGYRVSDREYNDPADPVAVAEQDFWTRVAKNHSHGEPVAIVKYDSKKHRVW